MAVNSEVEPIILKASTQSQSRLTFYLYFRWSFEVHLRVLPRPHRDFSLTREVFASSYHLTRSSHGPTPGPSPHLLTHSGP
jgi:hypothetical protein